MHITQSPFNHIVARKKSLEKGRLIAMLTDRTLHILRSTTIDRTQLTCIQLLHFLTSIDK